MVGGELGIGSEALKLLTSALRYVNNNIFPAPQLTLIIKRADGNCV